MRFLKIIILATFILISENSFSNTKKYELSMDCLSTENKLNQYTKIENNICVISIANQEICSKVSSSDQLNLTYVTESKNQIQIIDFKNKKVAFTVNDEVKELKCKNFNQYDVKKKDLSFKNSKDEEQIIDLENAKEIFLNKKLDIEKKIYDLQLVWDSIFFQANIKKIEVLRKEIELTKNKRNFIDAIRKIDEIDEEILNINKELERKFNQFFENAKKDYESLSFYSADENIKNAIKLKPENQESKQLRSKIKIIPKKIKILQNIQTARIENNKKKELEFLRELSKIQNDPELDIQIRKLSNSIIELDYQKSISRVDNFLKNGNIIQAEKFLTKAKKLYPNKSEISILEGKLNKLKEEVIKETLFFNFNTASKNDDWESSLINLKKIQKIEKNDANIKEEIEMVEEILSLKERLIGYTKNLHRLTNQKFKNLVEKDLKISEKYLDISPSLLKNYEEVLKVIEKSEEKVSVKIISDNETLIEIRGIGKVGKIKEKIIKLSPGKYYFIGKKNGFRESFLDVDLRKIESIELEIICIEKI